MRPIYTVLSMVMMAIALLAPTPAEAGCKVDRCKPERPHVVAKKGKAPIFEVLRCINPKTGRTVKCGSVVVNGRVCFVASDGRKHYDYPDWVWVGRKFFNHFYQGRWQPDWQN